MSPDGSPSAASMDKRTGSLEASADKSARRINFEPLRRDFSVRLAELIVMLAAIVGAIALGLGISKYFAQHRYVEIYLLAYAAFRFADLLVRDQAGLGMDALHFRRRVINELPLLLLFFSAPFERSWYEGNAPRWLGALGVLIELAGLWIALGARIQLGFFSAPPEGGRGLTLVRNGLYRYIRHPIYLGELLVLLAWTFEYAAPVTFLLALLVGILILRLRIRDEESEMLSTFGDDYEAYRRQTDALLPNLW